MKSLFTRLNTRRQQRLAASQTEQVPAEISKPDKKKSLFGRLLERTGSWVKPKAKATIDASELNGNQEWEETRDLDLSEQRKLPENFKTPYNIDTIRFNYDADQEGGIARDPALVKTLPTEKPVKAEFTISTSQIFKLLQNEPEKLTPEMARVITGSREGIKGLSDEALFKALHRLERKFEPTQLDKIDVEVKDMLLNKLNASKDKNIWKQTLKLKEFLRESKYESLAVEPSKPKADQKSTQKAKAQELKLLAEEIIRPAELAEIAGLGKMNIEKVANKILDNNLHFIKQRSRQGASYNKEHLVAKHIRSQLDYIFSNISDPLIKKSLTDIAIRSLQRLETKFENTGTQRAKEYQRLTALNEGNHQRLLYATALMNRDSGVIPSSKQYETKKLAS